jgi:hypothetical protein
MQQKWVFSIFIIGIIVMPFFTKQQFSFFHFSKPSLLQNVGVVH